ncbi:MAG: photosynthetic reaction center cytochrome PufC [Sphingomonadaceae bacterium]|nr:photosynthetic reaction center cytochrome PufC [Sphingomonadaceae bacterium]
MTSNAARLLVAAAALTALSGCEAGKKQWAQWGYRGVALNDIVDPDTAAKKTAPVPAPPYDLPPDDGAQRASAAYQNVKVLGHLSAEQFNHLMSSISLWVAGDAGNCGYCHNVNNFAQDDGYPNAYRKAVARRMIQQTWDINGKWSSHVQNVGVTCWTCHRGNGVPTYHWSRDTAPAMSGLADVSPEQNTPSPVTYYASLPHDIFSPYLADKPQNIRVQSTVATDAPRGKSTKETEYTYGLMMHMSSGLGVNCTYCHNSRAFSSWAQSSPQRVTAWYGIRMVRDVNVNYIESLQNVFPAYADGQPRKGPAGDVLKVNCATCHQGQYKPMAGYPMLKDYPYLKNAQYRSDAATQGSPTLAGAGMAGPAAQQVPEGAGLIASERDGSPLVTVYFATAKSDVTNRLTGESEKLRAFLAAHPQARLSISGYVDPRGGAAMNAELAKKRAQAVAATLAATGIPRSRIDLDKPADIVGGGLTLANERKVEVSIKGAGMTDGTGAMTAMHSSPGDNLPQSNQHAAEGAVRH